MPRSTEMQFTCPCDTTFAATIHQVVNITLEPRLLYRLLEGTLNVATCPNCGRKAESAQPFLYHDMQRALFAYVHPNADLPQADREALLQHLRRIYSTAVEESERIVRRREDVGRRPQPTIRRSRPYDDIGVKLEPEAPPMQVIFGTGRLMTLVDSLLEPGEKLGRVAFSARGADRVAQVRLLHIARSMAEQMDCEISVDDADEGYTVWIYGSRARISTIARAIKQPLI
jgi:hypothetical protein